MGSTRLPGKSLMPLGGKPLVANVLERASLATRLDEVVLAIPDLELDARLADLGRACGVPVFRGHATDLVDRYYRAAAAHQADVVVRIPADNPLIHPAEVDRIVEYYLSADVDFASNIAPFLDNQYPDGLGAEVFSFQLLRKMHQEIVERRHREMVYTYFRETPGLKLGTISCPEAFRRPDIKLDIDTLEDYNFISMLFDDLSRPGKLIDIVDIIPWYDAHVQRRSP